MLINLNTFFSDICHDSSDISDSDTDSQCSSISQPSLDDGRVDTIATMEVVEYEVASATESEDDYSSDVSSGTEVSLRIINNLILTDRLMQNIFLLGLYVGSICTSGCR